MGCSLRRDAAPLCAMQLVRGPSVAIHPVLRSVAFHVAFAWSFVWHFAWPYVLTFPDAVGS